ncbi:MAG: hypothetical protein ACI9OD_005129, partial [Limisphaerales bacterium]
RFGRIRREPDQTVRKHVASPQIVRERGLIFNPALKP